MWNAYYIASDVNKTNGFCFLDSDVHNDNVVPDVVKKIMSNQLWTVNDVASDVKIDDAFFRCLVHFSTDCLSDRPKNKRNATPNRLTSKPT